MIQDSGGLNDYLSIASTADAASVDCGQYHPSVIKRIDDRPHRRLDDLLPYAGKAAPDALILQRAVSTPSQLTRELTR